MDTLTIIFGFLGSFTAAGLFFPQVFKSLRTKKTHDIAWLAIIVGALNGIFWTTYGLLQNDPFIYVTNIVMFTGALLLAILKYKYK